MNAVADAASAAVVVTVVVLTNYMKNISSASGTMYAGSDFQSQSVSKARL